MNTQPMIEFENFPAEQFTGTPISVSENSVIIEFREQQIKATKTEAGWKLEYLYRNTWLTKYQKCLSNCKHEEVVIFGTASEALRVGMELRVVEEAYKKFRALALEKYEEKSSMAKDYFRLANDFEERLWKIHLRRRRSSASVENLKKDLE